MLSVKDLFVAYGQSEALHGISFEAAPKETVAIMGRNGMGKTTTIRSILGMTRARAGDIRFGGEEVRSLPSYKIAKLGIGLVPDCLLYTSPSLRDRTRSRMPSSA